MSSFNIDNFAETMLKLPERLHWDVYHMAAAILMGSRSNCHRLHVGCVIVKDQHIISAGYNGFLPKAPHTSCIRDGHEQATVHAEQNAIADAAKRGVSVTDAIAYVTHRPCINCAKILAASGIRSIKYLYEYGGSDSLVHLMMANANVNLEKVTFS